MSSTTRPCQICKQPIDPERVEALPDTRLCTEHAREIQKYGGEFTVTGTLERTSKPGSIKQNFGGVSTEKKRNVEGLRKLAEAFDREHSQKKEG
jgi:hypothetical protein